MNADRLLDTFNRVGDEPEAIQQFRKLVVGLAMSGKLVASHEAALMPAGLLKEIEARKRALVQKGSLRKQRPMSSVSFEDLPKGFANPSNFIRLGEIARIEKGQTGIMKAEPGAYPLVVTAEDRGTCNHFDFDGAAAIVPLVSSAGHGKASLQRLHYQEGKFALGSILAAIFPYVPELISARFLFEYLTAFKGELLVSQMIGTANVSLSIGKVADVPVPLVPPVVQRKVDELMGLCDRLEAARANREATRDRLTAASFGRLNAPDPETFEADARFALDALPALTTRPDQIKALRQTILNLAVRGKLVPQDADDEPASELLKRIAKEKARLVKAGEIRKPKVLPDVEEPPFDLPQNWRWTPIREVTSDRGQEIPESTFTYIDVTAIDKEAGIVAEPKVLVASEAPSRARKITRKGDVIYSCVRPYLLNVAVIETDFDPQPIASTAFAILNGHGLVMPRYIWIVLRSPFMVECVEENQRGQAYPAINDADFAVLPFPLPPFAEQHRIVAKVDALMALCDRLEASLAATAATSRRLADALLAEALSPANARELEAAE